KLPVTGPSQGFVLLPLPPLSRQYAPAVKFPGMANGSRPLPPPTVSTSAVAAFFVEIDEKPRMPANMVRIVWRGIHTRICVKSLENVMHGEVDGFGSPAPGHSGSDVQLSVWFGRFWPAMFSASVTAGAVDPASFGRSCAAPSAAASAP